MITIEYNKSYKICNIFVFRNKTGMWLVLYHISKQNPPDFNLAPLAVIIKIIYEFDPHPWSINCAQSYSAFLPTTSRRCMTYVFYIPNTHIIHLCYYSFFRLQLNIFISNRYKNMTQIINSNNNNKNMYI